MVKREYDSEHYEVRQDGSVSTRPVGYLSMSVPGAIATGSIHTTNNKNVKVSYDFQCSTIKPVAIAPGSDIEWELRGYSNLTELL